MTLAGRVHSLQVGRPAVLHWRGKTVESAIVKHPVEGPLHLGFEGFAGDEQADKRAHGGPEKAVMTLTDRRSDVTVAEVMRVTYRDRRDREALAKVVAVPELAPGWRASLEKLLARAA